jgi:hypothetical protein
VGKLQLAAAWSFMFSVLWFVGVSTPTNQRTVDRRYRSAEGEKRLFGHHRAPPVTNTSYAVARDLTYQPAAAWNFMFSVHSFFGVKTPKNE